MTDDAFPHAELGAAGYVAVASGQKTYNGVAVLVAAEHAAGLETVADRLPGDDADEQKRFLDVRVAATRVIDVYVPNGQAVGSDKYAYKLAWLARLADYLESACRPGEPLLVCGDFNIAPEDRDVHDAEGVRGSVMFSGAEQDALRRLLGWGLRDTLRVHTEEAGIYSWWDYRAGAFRRNLGWRIDLILATAPLVEVCRAASVDTWPRKLPQASDHAPVLAAFQRPGR